MRLFLEAAAYLHTVPKWDLAPKQRRVAVPGLLVQVTL